MHKKPSKLTKVEKTAIKGVDAAIWATIVVLAFLMTLHT
jgi:hypothetical protein